MAKYDEFGGFSSSRLVVRFKHDAFRRSNAARASAIADHDALSKFGVRFRDTSAAWGAKSMRRMYSGAFKNAATAESLALDRTFVLEVPHGTNTEALARVMATLHDEIEFAVPDVIGGVAGTPFIPNDTQFGMQWGMHNTGQSLQGGPAGFLDADIDAPEAWAIHTGDVGTVTVAVIDSGINSHQEFGNNVPPYPNGRIVQGVNTTWMVCAGGTNNGNSCSSGEPCPGGLCLPALSTDYINLQDGCPHGTHVAGIIGASGNNGGGVAGVTWGAYLMPVRVLKGCNGNSTDLAEGIIWAADHGADIINMSLQYNITSPALITTVQDAINYAHAQGALLVGATGNNNSCGFGTCSLGSVNYGAQCTSSSHCLRACIGGLNQGNACSSDSNCPGGSCAFPSCIPGVVCYPAKAANVLGVGATDNRDNIGSFSNFGAEVDVTAPGKDIWSTWTNGSFAFQFGTSMATPHVAGLGALIKSYVPELTNVQIADVIMRTVEDLGPSGWDNQYGFGRVNAHKALRAAAVWPGILASDPPDGAIDARLPVDRTGTVAQGWSQVTLTFPGEIGGVASGDFSITQTAAGSTPQISVVEPVGVDQVRVIFDRPIQPLAWTTLTHVTTGTRVRLGFLPGDINGDRTSAPADILALIDSLNGVAPQLAEWQTDIDRSGLTSPADILCEIDLLNGATPFDVYNGATLPPIP